MRKSLIVVVFIALIIFSSCSNSTIIGNKYYQNCVGNETPCANNTYYLGDSNHWWRNGYFTNLTVGGIPFTGNMSISSNLTGSGTTNTIAKFINPIAVGNSSIQDDGSKVTFSTNISGGSHYFNNLLNPSQLQDAATKAYVDSTLASVSPYNVFTVAKSGATYTTIQSAINAAAPTANATFPALVRIGPGTYNEAITCASYVHLASIGGSYGTVIIQQTDADICTLPAGANNISGVVFRLVTPSAARTIFKDNGNTNFCYLENVNIEITTPSTYAHNLISISGTGTVLVLNNFYSSVGGTGAIVGINISGTSAVITSSGMQITLNNVNAFDMKCTSNATVSMMNSVLGGTCSLFNVTKGTFQWTDCRLTGMGTNVTNNNTVHYAENTFIDAPVFAGDGSEVRLRNCSYKYVNRTGTGNIIDTSRKLQSGIFHVVDFTWNTIITASNMDKVKTGTSSIDNGGSGQGVMGVKLNSVASASVQPTADVTGGLESSFTCARTIRMQQTLSISQLPANGRIFMGVRQTLGNAIPTLAGVENYAGFVWDGANCMVQSSNGGGVGQSTIIASPVVGLQHFIEIEVLGSNRVDFYCDGILIASHKTAAGLPSGLVDWQRLVTSDGGGPATFMYMTLRNGSIEECPQ